MVLINKKAKFQNNPYYDNSWVDCAYHKLNHAAPQVDLCQDGLNHGNTIFRQTQPHVAVRSRTRAIEKSDECGKS